MHFPARFHMGILKETICSTGDQSCLYKMIIFAILFLHFKSRSYHIVIKFISSFRNYFSISKESQICYFILFFFFLVLSMTKISKQLCHRNVNVVYKSTTCSTHPKQSSPNKHSSCLGYKIIPSKWNRNKQWILSSQNAISTAPTKTAIIIYLLIGITK